MSFRVNVDVTNPGQFFACCGLLELADRLWPGAEGWFEGGIFCINADGTLPLLIQAVGKATLKQLDATDDTSSPMELGSPFRSMRLDWWQDTRSGGRAFKGWAGRMNCVRIAGGMQHAMLQEKFYGPGLFDIGVIACEPNDPEKKIEPFYFDSRRGANAHSRDVGFSMDALELEASAFPAVEFLCFVGLQRCQPAKTETHRIYDYFTWSAPLAPELVPAAISGLLPVICGKGFRFENWYRTSQKKT